MRKLESHMYAKSCHGVFNIGTCVLIPNVNGLSLQPHKHCTYFGNRCAHMAWRPGDVQAQQPTLEKMAAWRAINNWRYGAECRRYFLNIYAARIENIWYPVHPWNLTLHILVAALICTCIAKHLTAGCEVEPCWVTDICKAAPPCVTRMPWRSGVWRDYKARTQRPPSISSMQCHQKCGKIDWTNSKLSYDCHALPSRKEAWSLTLTQYGMFQAAQWFATLWWCWRQVASNTNFSISRSSCGCWCKQHFECEHVFMCRLVGRILTLCTQYSTRKFCHRSECRAVHALEDIQMQAISHSHPFLIVFLFFPTQYYIITTHVLELIKFVVLHVTTAQVRPHAANSRTSSNLSGAF